MPHSTAGVTLVDTADVYGDGRSEKIIAAVLKERGGEKPFVATKAGRRLNPHVTEGYTGANIEAFIDRSLSNLGIETLDLVQLHCPPTDVYLPSGVVRCARPAHHQGQDPQLRRLGREGRGSAEGDRVSGCCHRPDHLQHLPPAARRTCSSRKRRKKNVGVIVRVPLASGLLSGKITRDTAFAADDHRNFNRLRRSLRCRRDFCRRAASRRHWKPSSSCARWCPQGVPMAQFAPALDPGAAMPSPSSSLAPAMRRRRNPMRLPARCLPSTKKPRPPSPRFTSGWSRFMFIIAGRMYRSCQWGRRQWARPAAADTTRLHVSLSPIRFKDKNMQPFKVLQRPLHV